MTAVNLNIICTSNIEDICCNPRLHEIGISWMAAMLCDVVIIIVGRRRLWSMPLAILTTGKELHGFLFLCILVVPFSIIMELHYKYCLYFSDLVVLSKTRKDWWTQINFVLNCALLLRTSMPLLTWFLLRNVHFFPRFSTLNWHFLTHPLTMCQQPLKDQSIQIVCAYDMLT